MSDLNDLMSRDPLGLSAQDIDEIIVLQRKARSGFESGVKPKKETGPKASLDTIMGNLQAKPEAIKRRL